MNNLKFKNLMSAKDLNMIKGGADGDASSSDREAVEAAKCCKCAKTVVVKAVRGEG